jgi:2-oxoglutarate ferredoxin oxidoreductase subunit delta
MAYCHTIDSDRCKGCGLCVAVCPKNVLEISKQVNAKGYFPAYQARPEDCIACAMCCTMCPDVAITITEIEEEKAHHTEE